MIHRRRLFGLIGGLGTALAAPSIARAAWRDRPITLVVPWAAGGGTDLHARLIARLLEWRLGVPITVTNSPGRQGVVGHQAIASADPDGSTIGTVTVEVITAQHAGLTDLTYRDFTPISLVNVIPAGFHVRANSSWRDLGEALTAIRSAPGRHKATGGARGGIWHLAHCGLMRSAGLEPELSPWAASRGAARGLLDLLNGGADVVVCAVAEASALIDSGQVRALAVMNERRNAKYREVPTVREATGLDWQAATFVSIMGPRNMDAEIVRIFDAATAEAVRTREWAEFLASRGFEESYRDAAGLAAHIERVDTELGPLVRSLGLGPPAPIQR